MTGQVAQRPSQEPNQEQACRIKQEFSRGNRLVIRDVTIGLFEEGASMKGQSELSVESSNAPGDIREIKDTARKLTLLLVRKLEDDMNAGVIDHAQIRLLSAVVLKAARFWEKLARDTGVARQEQLEIQAMKEQASKGVDNEQVGTAIVGTE